MCKASILYLVEHGGLNPEWLMLNLLAHMSEEQARGFCEQHDLHITPEPTRTVEEAIEDLYDRRLNALFEDEEDEEEPDPEFVFDPAIHTVDEFVPPRSLEIAKTYLK